MRILYVGKHDSGGNDDEGAITHSLTKLGHDVQRVREVAGHTAHRVDADFMLCHHWHDMESLAKVKVPKVCWCFDLISWPDGGARHQQRVAWATRMAEVCDLLFFTDGDHVARDRTGKLHWLTQGADERPLITDEAVVDSGYLTLGRNKTTECISKSTDILFVGGIGYGRESFVQELRERYGERFKHVLKGCHGSALEYEVRSAKIVVAPDTPVTDRYWSNRIYNILRLGGFLLHPLSYVKGGMCKGLGNQYPYGGFACYESRNVMHAMIKAYLSDDAARDECAQRGHEYTMKHHTYTTRCAELVRTIQENLCL